MLFKSDLEASGDDSLIRHEVNSHDIAVGYLGSLQSGVHLPAELAQHWPIGTVWSVCEEDIVKRTVLFVLKGKVNKTKRHSMTYKTNSLSILYNNV